MATQSPSTSITYTPIINPTETLLSEYQTERDTTGQATNDANKDIRIKDDLSQNVSDASSLHSESSNRSRKSDKKKKTKIHINDSYSHEAVKPASTDKLQTDHYIKSRNKPLDDTKDKYLEPLKASQVCARNRLDGLFYPGVALKYFSKHQVCVQFADGLSDRIHTRYILPLGGAKPCPVLYPGDYVLARVRSKYGQHTHPATGECDYYIPAIIQIIPYTSGMTFPPSRSPLYTAISFNGRPIIALRSGLIRISKNYFLCICRYIQKLLTELANEAEHLDLTRRHPALPPDPFGRQYYKSKDEDKPSTESILYKLIEKQGVQQYELVERLTQVLLPQLKQVASFCEVGVQVVGTRDFSADTSPSTFTQGTSTQLDERNLDINSVDPKLETIEQKQQQLIEKLDQVQDIVQENINQKNISLQKEHPNAYLYKDTDNYILISNGYEESEMQESIQTYNRFSQTSTFTRPISEGIRESLANTMIINEQEVNITNTHLKQMYSEFHTGQMVMVDLREDGWFYVAEILQNNGLGNYKIRVKVTSDEILVPSTKILPSSTTEFQLPKLLLGQYVLAEHPNFSSCYAPGIIIQIEVEKASVFVQFYDDFQMSVLWSAIQPIEKAVYAALQSNALEYDAKWMTEEVVSRRDHNGIFYSSRIVGKSWITRHFMVKFDDGTLEVQSLLYIFIIKDRKTTINEGDYVLASIEAGMYMPGCVTSVEDQVKVRMCHGEDWNIKNNDVIIITEAYHNDIYEYIRKISEE